MKLEHNLPYHKFEKLNIKSLQDSLSSIDSKLWNLQTFRQIGLLTPHRHTTSLTLQYCPGEPEVDKKYLKYDKNKHFWINAIHLYKDYIRPSTPESFPNDIKEIEEIIIDQQLNYYTKILIGQLEEKFDGKSGLIIYANLPPNKKIPKHSDPGYYLSIVHRLHIPIFTNENCYFHLDDTTIHMEEGRLYEINNLMNHSVENKGDSDRVHLIVDIIPNSILRTIETSL